ncbi:MAG TPA: serine hydrolase domain-containing protein [Fibrella sp.]
MLTNSYSSKYVVRVGIAMLSCIGLMSCSSLLDDHRPPGSQASRQVQWAVDSVRIALEKSLGNSVPSLSVLIQTPTQRIFVSSVPAGKTPVIETANFRIASNSKNFTATAILNMHEEGWLNYKAHITDLMPGTNMPYVPNTPDWDFPYKKDITIEQLLQHSAGVYDVDNDPVPGFNGLSYNQATQIADPTHQFSTEEMVYQLTINKLSYGPPGTVYHYSNTGMSMLGEIIKRVYSARSGSAKTYSDYMQQYVVGPAAVVPLPVYFPDRADDVVLPAPRVEGTLRLPTETILYGDHNITTHIGPGNGIGTMAALNTYIRTLMKGQNVLRPETVKLMQTSVSSVNPTYALGCIFTPNLGYGHDGVLIGNMSLMMYDPLTDVSVVTYLPLMDFTQGPNGAASVLKCFETIHDVGYAARAALGYPGKP